MSQHSEQAPKASGGGDPAALEAEVLSAVRALVAELRPEGGGEIHVAAKSRLDRDLGLDSLARAELLLRLEALFEVELAESLLAEAETPSDLAAAVAAAVPAERPGRVTAQPEPAARRNEPEPGRS